MADSVSEYFRPRGRKPTCERLANGELLCDVCGQHKAKGVASSTVGGAVSAAYCQCCLTAGLEPPRLLRAAQRVTHGDLRPDLAEMLRELEVESA